MSNSSWMHDSMGAGGWLLATFLTMTLVLVLVGLIVGLSLWSRTRTGTPNTPTRSTPHDLLAERYARGEIDDEEYARRLQVLNSH